ncbi:hypothetical protein SLA2020_312840 [Shorea laevis]
MIPQVRMRHVFGESNMTADTMAKKGAQPPPTFVILYNCPVEVELLCLADAVGYKVDKHLHNTFTRTEWVRQRYFISVHCSTLWSEFTPDGPQPSSLEIHTERTTTLTMSRSGMVLHFNKGP